MNKTEILAALAAAGVTADESMTVAQLKELAAANNVSLVKAKLSTDVEAEVAPDDKELIAAKMAAGLSHEQAIEVINRQREHDAAAANL